MDRRQQETFNALQRETNRLFETLWTPFVREPEEMMERSAELVGIHARLSQMKGRAEEMLIRSRGEAVDRLRTMNPKITAKELEIKTDTECAAEERLCTDIGECIKSCNQQITVLITLISYEKNEMNFTNRVQQT